MNFHALRFTGCFAARYHFSLVLVSDMNYLMNILCFRNSIFSWAAMYLDRHKKDHFLRKLSEISCILNIKNMSPECWRKCHSVLAIFTLMSHLSRLSKIGGEMTSQLRYSLEIPVSKQSLRLQVKLWWIIPWLDNFSGIHFLCNINLLFIFFYTRKDGFWLSLLSTSFRGLPIFKAVYELQLIKPLCTS